MSELPQPSGFAGLANLASASGLDLTTVSTEYPILEPGVYPFNIVKAYYDRTKDKKGELLVVELVTTQPVNDKSGQPVGPGYKQTHRISLTPTEKMDAKMILQNVAQLLEGVFGEERKKIDLGNFDIAMLVNQSVLCRVATQPERDGFPESTRIQRFVKKSEAGQGHSAPSEPDHRVHPTHYQPGI